MAALPGVGALGQLVCAAGGFMPARVVLAPAGARLPAGVHSVVAVVVAPGGSGSRATGLGARGAGVVASLSLYGASDAVQGVPSGVVSSLSLDSAAIDAGVLGGLSFLSVDTAGMGAAAGGPARRAGLLFLHGDAAAGLGISSAALAAASAAGGRGGRLVVAATTGSEADGGVGEGSTADKASFVLDDFINAQAGAALGVVDELVPPTAELADVKALFQSAVLLAEQSCEEKAAADLNEAFKLPLLPPGPGYEGKKASALRIMRAWYGVARLAHAAYGLPPLPDEMAFLVVCSAPPAILPPVIINQAVPAVIPPLHVPDSEADLVNSVLVAVAVCEAAARAARASGSTADKGTFVFDEFITNLALDALEVVDELVPPAADLAEVKDLFESAVRQPRPGSDDDKKALALKVMRAWYRMAKITHAAYGQTRLPDEQAFLVVCLSPPWLMPPVIIDQVVPPITPPLHVPDSEADLVNSLLVAVAVCQASARAARASGVANADPNN